MKGSEYIEIFLINKNTIPNASAVLFRKDLYKLVGGADAAIKNCSDWFMWIKLLIASDVFFCATPMNYFRYHGQSVIASVNKKVSADRYHEKYDKFMRKALKKYLAKKSPELKNIIWYNKLYIAKDYGEEGLFLLKKKKFIKGWKKISRSMYARGSRLFYLKSAIKVMLDQQH